jgi:hypothetical protein
MLKRISGPKRNEIIGGWKILLHKEKLHNLYSSPNIIRMIESRRMRWTGSVARIGEERNAHRCLVGMPEGKKPLGRCRRRWVNNIKRDLREIELGGMD